MDIGQSSFSFLAGYKIWSSGPVGAQSHGGLTDGQFCSNLTLTLKVVVLNGWLAEQTKND
jgi:hypothetical protein